MGPSNMIAPPASGGWSGVATGMGSGTKRGLTTVLTTRNSGPASVVACCMRGILSLGHGRARQSGGRSRLSGGAPPVTDTMPSTPTQGALRPQLTAKGTGPQAPKPPEGKCSLWLPRATSLLSTVDPISSRKFGRPETEFVMQPILFPPATPPPPSRTNNHFGGWGRHNRGDAPHPWGQCMQNREKGIRRAGHVHATRSRAQHCACKGMCMRRSACWGHAHVHVHAEAWDGACALKGGGDTCSGISTRWGSLSCGAPADVWGCGCAGPWSLLRGERWCQQINQSPAAAARCSSNRHRRQQPPVAAASLFPHRQSCVVTPTRGPNLRTGAEFGDAAGSFSVRRTGVTPCPPPLLPGLPPQPVDPAPLPLPLRLVSAPHRLGHAHCGPHRAAAPEAREREGAPRGPLCSNQG